MNRQRTHQHQHRTNSQLAAPSKKKKSLAARRRRTSGAATPPPPRHPCAMLRLRTSILTHLALSSSSAYPCSSLRRLLSATAPRISPNPSSFAVEEYLVDTCGLTRPQALKASAKLSHLRSPAKPDAVLAFLAGLGLSGADAAAVVAKDPRLLCAKVDKTLAPVVAGLTGLGLSRSEIGRLVSLAPANSRCRSIVSKLDYYLPLFGSIDNLFRPLRRSNCPYISRISVFITFSLECRLRPRHYVVNFLKENGLLDREQSYYAICRMTEKAFAEKYICPHKEAAPHLAKYYAAACRGELPAQ